MRKLLYPKTKYYRRSSSSHSTITSSVRRHSWIVNSFIFQSSHSHSKMLWKDRFPFTSVPLARMSQSHRAHCKVNYNRALLFRRRSTLLFRSPCKAVSLHGWVAVMELNRVSTPTVLFPFLLLLKHLVLLLPLFTKVTIYILFVVTNIRFWGTNLLIITGIANK